MTGGWERSPLLSRAGAVPLPDAEQPSADPDAAVAWHYGDPLREQRELLAGTAVTDLSHRGLLIVSGPDRLSWLHSLTTQHLTELAPMAPVETLILSPHGHVEHALHLVDDGDVTWVSTEPLARRDVLDWLRGMRFRRKVQVEDVSEQWAAVGAVLAPGADLPGPLADALADVTPDADGAGTPAPPSWQDPWPQPGPDTGVYTGGNLQRHPGWLRPWREIWLPRALLAGAVDGLGLAGSWAAEALRVAAWRPRAGRENDHRTLPHEADWLRTSLHLTKGCYRGQETVAKIYHLGKPPRRLVMLHLDGSGHDLPAHGDPVHGDPGKGVEGEQRPIGLVTTAVRHHELGPVALALLKRNTPVDLALRVGDIAASQEVIVEP
jgi:folate-binding protein YgfZ